MRRPRVENRPIMTLMWKTAMRNQSRIQNPRSQIQNGFTLVELLVVMVIISIILSFILTAAVDARRRSEERATQSLITKLETGLNDRIDALLQTRPDYNLAHLALANIYTGNFVLPGYQRALAIAWTDYIKSEMPDVFFVQNTAGPYPLNFAANPFPGTPLGGSTGFSQLDPLAGYVLPTGNTVLGPQSGYPYIPQGTGIFGASYPMAAAIYKNLGYLPQGYDGTDNNGNGLIDEMAEGVTSANQAQVQANLINHKHITARSEMLYALLVEGRGPLGSMFNADDFTDREVQDTDQDGLPEFVDAWGQPLQFFRWPLLYHSDLQRGQTIVATSENSWTLNPPYLTAFEQREQDPLDLNQQLVAPAWWSTYNSGPYVVNGPAKSLNASNGVQAFESFFHRLTEPYPTPGGLTFWDRGTVYGGRREYYSKFLIVSSGLNQQLGVFLYSDTAIQVSGPNNASVVATALIANENNAMPFGLDLVDFTQTASIPGTPPTISYNPSNNPTSPSSSDLIQGAQDDISNQNIQSTVAIGGSG
jgi:prepilin-type N-terminal cleavage/methylation domain-containing protein